MNEKKELKEKRKKKITNTSRVYQNNQIQMFDNSYAQQIAADISSYKYGKRITGFIN